jgi:formylglycine-generating enzyme required for sulfatase activity/serine/threonine protein kinase
MDTPSPLHPISKTLNAYGLGKLDDGSAEAVNKHLEQCPDCRKRVAEMSADSFLGRIRDAQMGSGVSAFAQSQPGEVQTSKKSSAPPPADTLPPGLADHPDYEIKKELGRGGMGVVYLAHNKLMGRDEVLKVMGRNIMERPGVLDRFLREIRAVARLRHPNIVTAYSAVRVGESIVFAMEFVDGLDLARMVKAKGPLPVAHACHFVHQAALGLQHAHEEGLVHRDIKPGNLMLAKKGSKATVKVLDFGLAKATREEHVDSALTSQGQALGTPDFIAPEQILDAPNADVRADIYSLGATLYYLLTGQPPFKAKAVHDVYQAHISRDADRLNLVRPEVPSELAAVVAKMMAKDPARRFQTPGEVAAALTPFFKTGSAAFKSPIAEVSQAGQSHAGPPVTGAISRPAQPATDAGNVAIRAKKAAEPTVPEGRWESMIDLKETDSSIEATPSVEPTRRPPWVWPSVAVGVLILGFLAAWMGGVFKVKTSEGVIVLENVPKDADVFVDGSKITLTWPGIGKPLEIRAVPGQRKVEVKKDGFKTFGEVVTVKKDGSEEVTVRLEPLDTTVADSPAQATEGKPPVPPAAKGVASALRFNGRNTHVRIPKSSWKYYGDHSLTIEAVVTPQDSSSSTRQEILCDLAGDQGISLALVPGEGWGFLCFLKQETLVTAVHPAPVVLGRPVHLAGVIDLEQRQLRLFVDGKRKIAETSLYGEFKTSPWDTILGADPDNPGDRFSSHFRGSIEWLRISKSACYTEDFVPAPSVEKRPDTLALYLFDEGKGEILHDSSGRGAHARIVNGEWIPASGSGGRPAGGAGGSPTSAPKSPSRPVVANPPASPAPKAKPADTARPASSLKTWTNSLGMKFVRIEPGKFSMGSTEKEDEQPPHLVEITRPFSLGDRELTQGQYQVVMGVNPSNFKGSDDLPVEEVSWLDAVTFCTKLSKKERRTPCYRINGKDVTVIAGNGYRLPTEAEWEYACRAGSNTQYPFGVNKAELGEFAWFSGNAGGKTHPVGQKRPNRWGLYDMLGNVWEWCQDGYDGGYYATSPPADPPGPSGAASRVIRGGSWGSNPPYARPACRFMNPLIYRYNSPGLRLAAVRSE